MEVNNKVLVELVIPEINQHYDVYLPINKKIGTIKKLIEEELVELTEGSYNMDEVSNLYSKDTGVVYDINKAVRETDLKNGSRIILI